MRAKRHVASCSAQDAPYGQYNHKQGWWAKQIRANPSPPHHTIQINISMHILSPPFRSLLSVMKEGNDENGERNETKQQWTGIQFKIALTFCACVRTRVHVCVSVSACPSVFLDVWRTTGHYLICHLQLYVGKCQMNQGPNVCDLKYSFAVLLQSLCRHNKW